MAGPDAVAVGMDIGATATRALVVDPAGHRRGAGRSAGGNPTAHPQTVWARAVSDALSQALTQAGPVAARSVVVGVAGGGVLADSAVAASFEAAIRSQVGPGCPVQVLGDGPVAFSAGTPEPDGTVLVAGTGAVAAAIVNRSLTRETDGLGWLLGDAGSGFWIGREAVRAVLASLDGRGPATSMQPLVARALLGHDTPLADVSTICRQVVHAVHARPPVELSRLAPLATRCAREGDQVALAIASRAVSHLVTAIEVVRSPGETTPVVMAGGAATGDHPVAAALREQLETRWPACTRPVRDGVTGAAWLALRTLPGTDPQQAARLHGVIGSPDVTGSHQLPDCGTSARLSGGK